MSLTGMHIVCSPIASSDNGGVLPIGGHFGKTMPSAAIVGQVPGTNKALVRAHSSVQAFVAFSKVSGADALTAAADANRVRWIVEPGVDVDLYASAGDYVAWATA